MKPITPERILDELREVSHVSGLSIAPTSLRFSKFLQQDPAFAPTAAMIISTKLESIKEGIIVFGPKATNAKQGWVSALERIQPYLSPAASVSKEH
jgi:hypothetical protein